MSIFGPDNPNGLRVIKTARTRKKINKKIRKGFKALVQKVRPDRENIKTLFELYKNLETGELVENGDCRIEPEGCMPLGIIVEFYPYHFPSPYAAYMLPLGLEVGERVWLDDIIEDIVGVYGNQGYRDRLESCEAVWDGEEFQIDFNPETDAPRLIG